MQSMNIDLVRSAWKSWIGNDLDPHGPLWLQWLLTCVFCAAVALCFTVLAFAFNALSGGAAWQRGELWLRWYASNLAVSLVIGLLIHAMFSLLIPLVGKARIRGWSDARRSLFFASVPIAGVMIGWPLGVSLVLREVPDWLTRPGIDELIGVLLLSLLISFIFFQIFSARSRQVQAERRALEAQLMLLQAQMEPHFLFNTLAGVQTLIDDDPGRAKQMLEAFTDYLRATIASLRTEDSSVGQELELAGAYLGLMKQRMEDRLQFSIAADPALQRIALPALLLQPLVENAIQHGLEPKLEGGRVTVCASREGQSLRIEVHDDGLGPAAAPRHRASAGNGVALENIRQRLQGRFGERASLTLAAADPGMRATLRLPLPAADA